MSISSPNLWNQMGVGGNSGNPRICISRRSTVDSRGYPNLRTTAPLLSLLDAFHQKVGKEGSDLIFDTDRTHLGHHFRKQKPSPFSLTIF